MRTCDTCGETKSLTDFHKSGKGRRWSCKKCQHARERSRRNGHIMVNKLLQKWGVA